MVNNIDSSCRMDVRVIHCADCMHEVCSRIATAADMAAIAESSIDSGGDRGVRDKSYLLCQTAISARAVRSAAVHPVMTAAASSMPATGGNCARRTPSSNPRRVIRESAAGAGHPVLCQLSILPHPRGTGGGQPPDPGYGNPRRNRPRSIGSTATWTLATRRASAQAPTRSSHSFYREVRVTAPVQR
jgi:hypothetical protein